MRGSVHRDSCPRRPHGSKRYSSTEATKGRHLPGQQGTASGIRGCDILSNTPDEDLENPFSLHVSDIQRWFDSVTVLTQENALLLRCTCTVIIMASVSVL